MSSPETQTQPGFAPPAAHPPASGFAAPPEYAAYAPPLYAPPDPVAYADSTVTQAFPGAPAYVTEPPPPLMAPTASGAGPISVSPKRFSRMNLISPASAFLSTRIKST